MSASSELLGDLKVTGALMKGHFLLSSGMHSSGYVQCAKLLQHPELSRKYASVLAKACADAGIDAVIGPALGGVVIGYEIARQLKARALFTERSGEGKMLLRRGFNISPGEKVLIAEDVITTGKSTGEVIDIVREMKGQLAGVCCLIDRSGGKFDAGVETAYVIRLEIASYPADACPLCGEGIPLEKPGSREKGI